MGLHVARPDAAENLLQLAADRERDDQIDADPADGFRLGISAQSLRSSIPIAHAAVRVDQDVRQGQPVDREPIRSARRLIHQCLALDHHWCGRTSVFMRDTDRQKNRTMHAVCGSPPVTHITAVMDPLIVDVEPRSNKTGAGAAWSVGAAHTTGGAK